MTTDTYPKVATATVKLGDTDVTINGIAKGAGMIAPDMATMLVLHRHRRADRGPRAAGSVVARHGQDLQCGHRRQRHLDQRHAAALRHRQGRRSRRARDRRSKGCAPRRVPPGARQGAEIAGAAGGARRRGRPQAGRSHRHRREIGKLGQAHRAVDRQFAAGQDGGRRRGRQLGPRRHGRRQGRRAGRPRPAVDLVRRQQAGARGRARPRLFRGKRPRLT